jgi:hypothetical protein
MAAQLPSPFSSTTNYLPSPFSSASGSSNPFNWSSLASGLGAIGGGLAGFFNSPVQAGAEYFEQIPGAVTPYYQPYIDAGQRSLNTLEQQFMQLLTNPQATYDMLAGGFEESPGYQFQQQQGQNAANSAAAAGGYAGSNAAQQTSAMYGTQMANKDFYNYLDRMLGLFGQGLKGTQGINQMGYNASTALAQQLARALGAQGMMAALQAQQENASAGGVIGGTVEAIGSAF